MNERARLSRRSFLAGTAASVAGLSARALHAERAEILRPRRASLGHVVVVMMENRSFDHLLGWLPGADGRQGGLVYRDAAGAPHATHALAPDFQGCGHADPDHSWDGGRVAFAGGACDGWLRAGANDDYAIGYYTEEDLPFLGRAARDWTVCDRYFAATMGPTFPNRFYAHAAATDRISNTGAICTLPTIWDRLLAAGLRGANYHSGPVSFLSLWGDRYASLSRPYDEFLEACATGRLPDVSFVDPPTEGEGAGASSDDHPFGDIRAGEAWLAATYRAITQSPAFSRTLLVITFDEWGGFFDHVPPSEAPDADPAHALRGFRVPTLLVSPWSRGGGVVSRTFDHASILRTIEARWRLAPLTPRDASANDLTEALDFSSPDFDAPVYDVPARDSAPCPAVSSAIRAPHSRF